MKPQRQRRRMNDVHLLSKPYTFLPYTRFVVWPWNHRISHSWLFLLGVCLEWCLYFSSFPSTMYLYINHQAYTKSDHYICHKLRQGNADGFDIVRATRYHSPFNTYVWRQPLWINLSDGLYFLIVLKFVLRNTRLKARIKFTEAVY